jgi:hypothetical protein|tara:strand:+ start:128 stop:535 length:408 start_codon:yes stop_codon:yes gene_type:complete
LLVIIGCGQSKRAGTHEAASLYTSGYFRLKLAYARTIAKDDSILILSGKYGFVRLNERISSYDQHIGNVGAVSDASLREQATLLKNSNQGVVVLGGSDYVERVRRLWPDCTAPLNGGLPQQMKWLKAQIKRNMGD